MKFWCYQHSVESCRASGISNHSWENQSINVLISIDLHTWNAWLPWMKTSANGDIKNTAFIQKQVTFQTDYS